VAFQSEQMRAKSLWYYPFNLSTETINWWYSSLITWPRRWLLLRLTSTIVNNSRPWVWSSLKWSPQLAASCFTNQVTVLLSAVTVSVVEKKMLVSTVFIWTLNYMYMNWMNWLFLLFQLHWYLMPFVHPLHSVNIIIKCVNDSLCSIRAKVYLKVRMFGRHLRDRSEDPFWTALSNKI